MIESSQAFQNADTNQRIVKLTNSVERGVIMRFRILLATVLATALAGGVFAQSDKHVHEHGSVKATEAKASADAKPQIAAKDLKERLDKGEKIIIIDARHELGGQILKGAIHIPL